MIKVITNPQCPIKKVHKFLNVWSYYDLTETFYKTHSGELYISFELVPLFHIFYGLVFIIYNPLKVVKGLFCLPFLTHERD